MYERRRRRAGDEESQEEIICREQSKSQACILEPRRQRRRRNLGTGYFLHGWMDGRGTEREETYSGWRSWGDPDSEQDGTVWELTIVAGDIDATTHARGRRHRESVYRLRHRASSLFNAIMSLLPRARSPRTPLPSSGGWVDDDANIDCWHAVHPIVFVLSRSGGKCEGGGGSRSTRHAVLDERWRAAPYICECLRAVTGGRSRMVSEACSSEKA
ncbi:hypothetical protein B0H14DRAFT_2998729 [Mycena olivaceomarginata]|nr:hypothetical protein B0H14DRAFT_2998729 [Mycena olivaceomarginata]